MARLRLSGLRTRRVRLTDMSDSLGPVLLFRPWKQVLERLKFYHCRVGPWWTPGKTRVPGPTDVPEGNTVVGTGRVKETQKDEHCAPRVSSTGRVGSRPDVADGNRTSAGGYKSGNTDQIELDTHFEPHS